MKRKKLITLILLISVLLAAELIFLGVRMRSPEEAPPALDSASTTGSTPEETSGEALDRATEASGEETAGETTEESLTEATEETEPQPQRFVLTFVGDCTLGCTEVKYNVSAGFIQTVGTDYDYPFSNVRDYFENDDFTIANLEGVLTDEYNAVSKTFAFRGPTDYSQILSGSSVEAVTLANNHTMDHGLEGYTSTTNALDAAGVAYVETDSSILYTTETGLTIGIYAVNFTLDPQDMQSEIAALRMAGAEIIIAACHWGTEGSYRFTAGQTSIAQACIDAGADIVYGCHPHVLQAIEQYQDGVIYYSLGNFAFGGNTNPRDKDSAILQQEIIRELDGTVRLGELTIIPVSVSSVSNYNDYRPTPYAPDTEGYNRVLSKLNGTFTGPDLTVDYSEFESTGATEPEESTQSTESTEAPDPTEATEPPTDSGSGSQEPPVDSGGSSGEAPEGTGEE